MQITLKVVTRSKLFVSKDKTSRCFSMLYGSAQLLLGSLPQQTTQIDTDLKSKASAYNSVKGSLQSLERKATYVLAHIGISFFVQTISRARN